jgi:hypothetical protein
MMIHYSYFTIHFCWLSGPIQLSDEDISEWRSWKKMIKRWVYFKWPKSRQKLYNYTTTLSIFRSMVKCIVFIMFTFHSEWKVSRDDNNNHWLIHVFIVTGKSTKVISLYYIFVDFPVKLDDDVWKIMKERRSWKKECV